MKRQPAMALARELAERITALRSQPLPAEALRQSDIAVMDTLGCMLAGASADCVALLRTTLAAGSGPCWVAGAANRASPLDAALINGTAAHALDYDNGSNTMGGHASATMVPALLAAAEAFGGSGHDLLVAHSIGFEVGTRIGLGVNFHHYEKGWHPTSTLGTFAVIGACASLLALTAAQTEVALGIGASLASGIKANFGTMVKPLHVGHCARNGLFAVLLAKNGYSASSLAFEHKQGFFEVYNGSGCYDAARILEHWAAPLQIITPGAGYKQYPCCAATHAALDAAFKITARNGNTSNAIAAPHIARVETWTPARRLAHTDRPQPTGNLDAKFSVQYCVARALLEGRIVMEHFENDAWRDTATRELMARVHSAVHQPGQFPSDNHFGAEVRVTFSDGSSDRDRVDIQLGRTTDHPIPLPRLQAKFADCASRALPHAQVQALTDALGTLERLPAMHRLTTLMTGAAL